MVFPPFPRFSGHTELQGLCLVDALGPTVSKAQLCPAAATPYAYAVATTAIKKALIMPITLTFKFANFDNESVKTEIAFEESTSVAEVKRELAKQWPGGRSAGG